MTRLVRVRAICDVCSAAAATRFCASLWNVLCEACTCIRSRSLHQHVALSSAIAALPFCEYCDIAPATLYCETEGATLCDKCDETVHRVIPNSHCRSPLQITLRTRAVEFRPRSRSRARKRFTRAKATQPLNRARAEGALSYLDSKEHRNVSKRSCGPTPRASKVNVASKLAQQRQQPGHNAESTRPYQVPSPPMRKPPVSNSSGLATHSIGSSTPSSHPQPLRAKTTEQPQPIRISQAPNPGRNDLFHIDEYRLLFDSQLSQSNAHMSIDTLSFSSIPTEIAEAAKSLCEPLLITEEPNIQPMETDPLAEPESGTLDLSNILPTEPLDLSTEDSLHHVSMRPPPPSPYAPSSSVPTSSAVYPMIRQSSNPTQSSITAAVAAAATAAAEKYLLNTAPRATASKERVSAATIDGGRAVDPSGLAAAATAAAAVEMTSLSTRACDPELHERGRLPRHVSEPVLPLRAAAQQHVFDEAMRRLDIDLDKHSSRDEIQMANLKELFNASDTSNVLVSEQESTSSELGRHYVIEDYDRQKEAFGMVGCLRPSQFDQTHMSSLALERDVDFCAPQGSDER